MRTDRRTTLATLLPALVLAAGSAGAETTQCTPVTTVPFTISAQGVYCLSGDLATNLASGSAIEVAANNVVLDLNGHRLAGRAGAGTAAVGINVDRRQNVTVRNGTVRGFYIGIGTYQCDACVIERVRAELNTSLGMFVNGQGAIARDNVVALTGGTTLAPDADGYGIMVGGDGSRLLRNDVSTVTKQGHGTAYGFFIGGINHLLMGNRITDADRAISFISGADGKYRDTLTSGITGLVYGGGTDAGNNH